LSLPKDDAIISGVTPSSLTGALAESEFSE
jgi:hypothetical protein